jgi:hypothetical protein
MLDELEFEPFDLSVLDAGSQGGLWLSASSRLGAVNAVPRTDEHRLAELQNDADWFRAAIRDGRAVADQGAGFGTQLHDLVFSGEEIPSLFRRTRGAAAANSRPLLVRLLAAPEAVAALPWELIRDPEDLSTPLVFAPDVHFVRSARDRRYPLRLEPIAPPLHVLLVLSNPNPSQSDGADDAPFDHYEEGRALLAELRDLIDRGVMLVDVVDRPSVENLRRRIGARERGYHVLHYLGHARPDALKLEGSSGSPSWVKSDQFNALLRTNPDLRLAFFAGCRTASLAVKAREGEFASQLSIADRCVRDACQTVVGMQAVLPFRAEQVLTRAFYQALCTGATVSRALGLARAATRDDGVLGKNLLNWAVPSVVTGHLPGRIVAPQPENAVPVPQRPRRAQLKLDLTEPDREFFARFSQLREALTVLCRLGPNRVVWISGPPGAGKSRLLARALDQLDDSIVAVLYVRAPRLAERGNPTTELCQLVDEMLQMAGRPGVERRPTWASDDDWWDRLIEELVATPFVLAIDDVDQLDEANAATLGAIIDRLVGRMSMARVAIAGGEGIREGFLSAETRALLSPVHVLTLEPGEVTQWVRRNRPALAAALAAVSETELGSIHNQLGFKLHLWSRLADEYDRQLVKDVPAAVEAVMRWVAATAPAPTPAATPAEAGRGPIRVAIAGPYTQGRQKEFADAIGALALQFGAGARVVPETAPDAGTAAAHLLSIESPFMEQGTAGEGEIAAWLERLLELHPDIVLLDYGSPELDEEQELLLRRLSKRGALLVAAGGNTGAASYPAWHDFVIAVGGLEPAGGPAPYSPYFPEARKPDLYALGTVAGTPLASIPVGPTATGIGTSFAALNVVMAATCVWALDRTMTARQVAGTLRKTAKPVDGAKGVKRLDIDGALNAARARLVMRALLSGPLDEQGVAAATGLSPDTARPLLDALVGKSLARLEGDRYVGEVDTLKDAVN